MRAALILALASAASAQPSRDPATVLARARDKLLDRADRIDNYMCVETVNRSYLKNTRVKGRSTPCDRIMGDRKLGKFKLELEATDRLRLDVKISGGLEIGAWAGARQFDARSIIDFVGKGVFGTGALGSLIGDILLNRGAQVAYADEETLNGGTVLNYRYEVPMEASHYRIRTNSAWVTAAYGGEIWIDPEMFELRRLTAKSSELPPETTACVADMDVLYAPTKIDTRDFLFPGTSEMHFIMRDGTESHSLTRYAGCREYRAESIVRFDESPPDEASGGKAAIHAPTVLPAGLDVQLALTDPIDTDTAAAGDVVTAKVVSAVRRPRSKEIAIPAGAMVRGRIVKLMHLLGPQARFEITILPRSIEIRGVESPFNAMRNWDEELREARRAAGLNGRAVPTWMPRREKSQNTGMFYFRNSKNPLVVPAGTKSTWITTETTP